MVVALDETELLEALIGSPRDTRRILDKIDAETSLLSFVRLMWPVLEPGRKFVGGWAIEAICEHLEAVSRGEIRRLLINVPPGSSKSLTTCVFWPAFEWGPWNRPSTRYVCASYSEKLTLRDNLRCRRLIQSDIYAGNWGDRVRLVSDQNAKMRFETDRSGFKVATSVRGVGTGERGDRVIIDDPHNVKEGESEAIREDALQWFTEVVPSRLNDLDESAIVVIMQRVHERDVSGHILSADLGYEHLCLPMRYERAHACSTSIGFHDPREDEGELLWPERFSPAAVDRLERELSSWGGGYAVSGQLQQRPVPRGGGLFQRKDFQLVDAPPAGARRVRGWDLAASTEKTSPWTAGVKLAMAGGRIYIEDARRRRATPGEVEALIETTSTADGGATEQSLPQDPGQAGKAQKAALARLLHGFRVHFSLETGSKEDRARPLAAQAEAGNVYVVRGDWNDEFLAEVCSFPRGAFSDQVDAASRAYARLIQGGGRERVATVAMSYGGEG